MSATASGWSSNLRKILSLNPGNAFNFFGTSVPERRVTFYPEHEEALLEKHLYTRPEFLQLTSEALTASRDHDTRVILTPHRELPLNAGYAEAINAGKTPNTNEDQATAGMFCLHVDGKNTVSQNSRIAYSYFAIFDGHGGTGSALMASQTLHSHIEEKLDAIKDLLVYNDHNIYTSPLLSDAMATTITTETLVRGVLEQAFIEMDEQIRRERQSYRITGGCTAVVALILKDKLYVANAGDSRATLVKDGQVIPMSVDFTPGSERQRLQKMAHDKPDLLGDEFGRLEFQQRPRRKHLGEKLLYRDWYTTGWCLKVIKDEDVNKFPMILGEGKKARLLDTIATTRGFGDHDLRVPYNGLRIKPFLSPVPEVRVYNLASTELSPDDVLVMASDGLWERLSNEEAANFVMAYLSSTSKDDKRRYCVAAQNLVAEAKGNRTDRGWKRSNGESGSYDDISCFIIPLGNYLNGQETCIKNISVTSLSSFCEIGDAEMAEAVSNEQRTFKKVTGV